MENSLLITLGHNSSAIFVYGNGRKVIGYEQERISGIKADSQFPKDAINEIRNYVGAKAMKDCSIFISHWFNDATPDSEYMQSLPICKYISETDIENLMDISKNITFVDKTFTHHDAHAWSADAFFNYYLKDKKDMLSPNAKVYTIVADGFGTNEEVLSVYCAQKGSGKEPELVKRVYGYEASLGLMYQYATSFCGMKENQDEYKFLGYEAHIDEYLNEEQIDALDHFVEESVNYLYDFVSSHKKVDSGWLAACSKGIINFKKLKDVKVMWHEKFAEVANEFITEKDKNNSFKLRCVIAYYIQQTMEHYFYRLVTDFEMKNVIVVGGCFYNVKLNNEILSYTNGLFCAMPLAGDQGAAIGMYSKFTGMQFPFETLAIGPRRLYNAKKLLDDESKGMYYISIQDKMDLHDAAVAIANDIASGKLVNIVHKCMEFGPRALCNTSTVFLPTVWNVADNNHMNNRNEVMPCAPICTEENARILFDANELSRVVGSDHFMICTHPYVKPYSKQYGGVMHRMTLESRYSGRPQIVRDGTFMHTVLELVEGLTDAKCLVNTSFNVHGRPIAFDTTEIYQNFMYQREHAEAGKEPVLYVIE